MDLNHTPILGTGQLISIKEGEEYPDNEVINPDGNKTFIHSEEELNKPEMILQNSIQHESSIEPVKSILKPNCSSFHPLNVRKCKTSRRRTKSTLEVVSIDNLQDKLFLQQFFRCSEFPDSKSPGAPFNNKINPYLRLVSMPRNYSKTTKYSNCESEIDSFILRRRERNRERMRKLRSNPEYAAKERERVRERKRIKTLYNLQKQSIDSNFSSSNLIENTHTYIIPEKFEHLMKIRAYNREMQRKRRSNPEYAAKERERNREYQRQRRKMKAEMRSTSSDLNAALFGKILQCNLEVDPHKLIPECNIEGSSDSIQSEVESRKMTQPAVYVPNTSCNPATQMYSSKCVSNNFDRPVHNSSHSIKRITPSNAPFDETYIIQMIKREKNRESMRRRRSDPEYRRKEKERRKILAEERKCNKLIPM